MALTEPDRAKLWDRAGSRCSICKAALIRPGHASNPGQLIGWETAIRTAGQPSAVGLILSERFLASYDNSILLCVNDDALVNQRRHEFTPEVLARLRASHENWIAQLVTGSDSAKVTLRVHVAMFMPSSAPHYFLKATNESRDMAVRLNRIWFATQPEMDVDNPHRRLPTELEPGGLFETWLPVSMVTGGPDIEYLARVELGDGSVIESQPNTNVASAGVIGGGGRPLTALAESVAAVNHFGGRLIPKEWDVFLSHASEDKAEICRPLANALIARGVKPWLDVDEILIGDLLWRKLEEGLARSRFGVVVLSPHFFAKHWTKHELNRLVYRSVHEGQIILPIWHNVTADEVEAFSPTLLDWIARDTSRNSLDEIADEILQVVERAKQP